jgi:DNA-binding transcriptional MerR regulator
MNGENVIGAFSEDQAARISGVSVHQLRQWSKEGFFPAAYGTDQKNIPYGRIYSFRDLVSLQVLNDLRNEKKIPLRHLREVSDKLDHLGDRKWSGTTLYVLGKRVVLEDPSTKKREDVVSGQKVFNIPLRVVIKSTRERIKSLNDRQSAVGEFSKKRFVVQNELVFEGTRIPVAMVLDFHDAGYSISRILNEFPALAEADVQAAIRSKQGNEAA